MNSLARAFEHRLIVFLLLLHATAVCLAQDTSSISRLISLAARNDLNSAQALDSSLIHLNEARLLAEKLGTGDQLYGVYDQYSMIFQKSGNYSLALEYLFKMMAFLDGESTGVHDTIEVKRRYASLYTQIGNCYFNLNNFKSLDYYNKSLEVVSELATIDPTYPVREREVMILINIGSAYLSHLEFDTAEQYFRKALELNATLGNAFTTGSLYNNMGIVFKERNDFEKAFEYYNKSLEIRSELKDSIGLAQTCNNLGDAYCLTGRYREATDALNKALEMSRKTGNITSQMKAANFLSIAYEKMGEPQKALEMYRIFNILNDSITGYENIQNSIRLEMQYQYEKQMRENELQQQITIAKKERQALLYMIISVFLLTSIAILVLLYRNQKIRARNSALEKNNLQMELEFRNKELSTHVLYLLKKNEFIASIAQKLYDLQQNPGSEAEMGNWIQDTLKELQSNIDNTVWNEFEVRFQQVHKDFYRKLMEKYPDLTPNEIKICAFLKLNMTSKDISAITFQSVKSLEVARHRLRKKMGIDRYDNLVTLLQNL